MNALRHRRACITVLAAAGLLAACGTTRVQRVHLTPGFNARNIHKALVIGLIKNPDRRKLFEDEFCRQWKKRGVQAAASYSVLPPVLTLDKAGVGPFAKAQGYDAVLVTRLVRYDEAEAQLPDTEPRTEISSGTADNSTLSQHLDVVVASPEYGMDYAVAVARTNVYDAQTEKLIWSGISQTIVTGEVPKLIGPFIEVILKTLYARQ